MRAIVVDRWMDPSELQVSEAPAPGIAPGKVRIAVRAAGCNFFDILQCKGEYQVKPPFPFIPGAEVGGVVAEVGEGVDGLAVGDRVLGSCGLGGFAEEVVAPAGSVYRIPDAMSYAEGAALPVIYPTSYMALVNRAPVQKGETLLVHAAAGGVGTAAVQIGKKLGARVIGTAGGAEKLEVARKCGADVVIDYREEDFVARVMEETDGRGADVIYDSVGGDIFDRSLKCIAWNGRLLVIGFAGGRIPEVKANRILLKNIAIIGLNFGGHAAKQPEVIPATMEGVFRMYEDGGLDPVIYGSYPLADAARALGDLGSRKTWGKVILEP